MNHVIGLLCQAHIDKLNMKMFYPINLTNFVGVTDSKILNLNNIYISTYILVYINFSMSSFLLGLYQTACELC